MPKSEAIIWKIGLYEKKEKEEAAECILCRENGEKNFKIKTKNHATTGLVVHLKSKHSDSDHYKKYIELENVKETPKGSIVEFLNIQSGGGLSAMDKRVINFVCCTMTSFGALNNPTTHAFAKEKILDESHYRKKVLPQAYAMMKRRVSDELANSEMLSFTTDIWSSPTTESFISLTAHCINKKWERKNFILAVNQFPGAHTGERVNEQIMKLLDDWKINTEKCHLFVRDGGANMKKAFEGSPYKHADCAAHLLNLVVRDALKHPPITKLITRCKSIVGHFKHSNSAMTGFKEIQLEQELPEHQLLQDMPVRWNSAFIMIKRFLEQRVAIQNYAFKKERTDLDLNDTEWAMLGELIELLSPLEELTRLFCDSSISVQYSFAMMTKSALEELLFVKPEIRIVQQKIQEGLRTRFGNLIEKKEISVAQFLDPRIKDRNSDAPELFRRIVLSWLEGDGKSIVMDDPVEFTQPVSPPEKRQKFGLLDVFEERMDSATDPSLSSSHSQPDLRKEFAEYSARPREQMNSNPLEFWRQNEREFPLLAIAARRYLSSPATSVASEQTFSTARDVFSYRRMRIKPRKAEMIIFLNRSLPQFNFKY